LVQRYYLGCNAGIGRSGSWGLLVAHPVRDVVYRGWADRRSRLAELDDGRGDSGHGSGHGAQLAHEINKVPFEIFDEKRGLKATLCGW
jgi:hypothetical protein